MHYDGNAQRMMPNGPMPGEMPPTPYSSYQQINNMQQYSPCQPMPAMTPMNGGYPSCPSVPPPQQQQQMCHPAYQQPPQLPGGYPCSPGRRPHSQQAHQAYVADWIDPASYNYSPAPSVAPSVMSHGSYGPIPCDGSTMSIPSTMYGMDCGTPDMRPNSVISTASYSENVDPLHGMPPGMPPLPQHPPPQQHPLQPQHRQRPTFPQLLENVFRNPALRLEFANETRLLVRDLYKRQGQKIPVEYYEYAKLLPRILFAIAYWPIPIEMQTKLATCYKTIVNTLPEEAVLPQLFQPGILAPQGQEPPGMHIQMLAQGALQPNFLSSLLHPLNTILSYKSPKKNLRGFLRTDAFLTQVMLLLSAKAPQIRPTEYMYLLSVLSWLASRDVETQRRILSIDLKENGQLVLPNGMKGIIGVIFGFTHQKCFMEINQGKSVDDPKFLDGLKVVRQMIALLLILGYTPFNPTVASQIVEYNGLDTLTGYLHLCHRHGRTSKEYIVSGVLKILKQTCKLKGTEPIVERMKFLPNAQGFIEKILDILATCDYKKPEDVELTEELTQMIYSVTFASQGVREALSQRPSFTSLVTILERLYRSQTALRCPKDGSDQWKRYRVLLDCQDTLLLTLRTLFHKCPEIPRSVLSDSVANLLAVSAAQIGEVPSWTELSVVQAVQSTIQMTTSMFKTIGSLLPSNVILNSFNNRTDLLESAFSIADQLLDLLKRANNHQVQLSESVAKKLAVIVPAVFELLGVIWMIYDQQREGFMAVRHRMKILIISKTQTIYQWLEQRRSTKDLKVFLNFCEVVVYDDDIAKSWSNTPEMVEYFDSMTLSQDAELSRLAATVRDRITSQNSSFTSDMCQAMSYGLSM